MTFQAVRNQYAPLFKCLDIRIATVVALRVGKGFCCFKQESKLISCLFLFLVRGFPKIGDPYIVS